MRLEPGQWAPDIQIRDIRGMSLRLQQFTGRHILLSFNKWTTCPFSTLRMMRLAKHYDSLRAQGLAIIALYHSPEANLRTHFYKHPVPFPVASDPDMEIYRAYGIGRSVWGCARTWLRIPKLISAMRHGFVTGSYDADPFMLPADFLIGPDLKIKIAYYGKDWGDHLSLKSVRTHLAHHAELYGSPEPALNR